MQHALFAANYNKTIMWVYEKFGQWLAAHDVRYLAAELKSEDEAIVAGAGADICLAYHFEMTRRILEGLPKLRLLMASGNGYNHIDVAAATDLGIMVTNCASYNVEDVGEHALALILMCSRKVREAERGCRAGHWMVGAKVQPTHRFCRQTVGVIGLGRIGRVLARHARALGFRVIADDPYVPEEQIISLGAEPVTLQECLTQGDFVSLHVPLNAETRRLLGATEFRAMKPSAYLINTSRGAVIDETALIQALETGQIAGAALDVVDGEPPALSNRLFSIPNVIITGHSAGTSQEGIEAWQQEWRQIVVDYLGGRRPANLVNPEVLSRRPPWRP